MASSEWMELENLSREISDSQGRLEAAKSVESFELAAVLEREIAEMEERRGKLLAHIANSVVGEETGGTKEKRKPEAPDAAAQGQTASDGDELEAEEEAAEEEAVATGAMSEAAQPHVLRSMPLLGSGTPKGVEAGTADHQPRGGGAVWNQLTPADVDRAKHELERRRAEILARHAEELKSLNADAEEIDALEQAINVFLRKFSSPAPGGEVVRLDQRQPRAQAAD